MLVPSLVALLTGGCSFAKLGTKAEAERPNVDERGESAKRREADALKEIETK
jgi:hypothetical protein